jgi:hypothetical protein
MRDGLPVGSAAGEVPTLGPFPSVSPQTERGRLQSSGFPVTQSAGAGGGAVPHIYRYGRGDIPRASSVGGQRSPGPTVVAGVGQDGGDPAGGGGGGLRSCRVRHTARTSPPAGAGGVRSDCSALPLGSPRGWRACAVAAPCRPRWPPVASSPPCVQPRLAGPAVGRGSLQPGPVALPLLDHARPVFPG